MDQDCDLQDCASATLEKLKMKPPKSDEEASRRNDVTDSKQIPTDYICIYWLH